jgi:23S rRNA (adenine2503-C2)-methyltransferase
MTLQPDLAGLELQELEQILASKGIAPFHARQLYRWIFKRGVTDFEQMTDLSKSLRSRLGAEFTLTTPAVVNDEQSVDGTRKFVLELADGKRIESVFIPDTPAMTF